MSVIQGAWKCFEYGFLRRHGGDFSFLEDESAAIRRDAFLER